MSVNVWKNYSRKLVRKNMSVMSLDEFNCARKIKNNQEICCWVWTWVKQWRLLETFGINNKEKRYCKFKKIEKYCCHHKKKKITYKIFMKKRMWV